MPASLVDLNEDVLLALVSFLDPTSARQLSLTARGLHVISKYRSLESVTLTSFRKTTQFCNYMLKDMPHRLPALRELRVLAREVPLPDVLYHRIPIDVPYRAPIRHEGRLLAAVLAEAKNLRILVMYSAEYWVARAHEFPTVLASLRNLQEIQLENAGMLACGFISRMRAKPRILAFLNDEWVPEESRMPRIFDGNIHIPSVEYLIAYDPVHQPEDLRNFPSSFPSVKRFDILRVPMFKRDREVRIMVDWPSLERVRGSVFSFDWRNRCGVHLLQLINRLSTERLNAHRSTRQLCEENVGPVACTCAISALDTVQPVALVIHLDVTAEWVHLEPIVASSARLRYLAVALDDLQLPDVKVNYWWAAFCHGLVNSQIVCLEVRLPDSRISEDGQAPAASDSKDGIRYKRAIVRMVSRSAGRLPQTLRYLSLDLRPRGQSPWRYDFLASEEEQTIWTPPDLYWWSVTGEGDSRGMEPLHAQKGERIAAHMRSVKYDYTRSLNVEQDVPVL